MNRPDQLSLRSRNAERNSIARMREEANALTSIEDYSTASGFALDVFAARGDLKAKAELERRWHS